MDSFPRLMIGATLLASIGIAVDTSIIISGILTIILAIYLVWSARRRDNNIRKELVVTQEEIKLAKHEIIYVLKNGDRRDHVRDEN